MKEFSAKDLQKLYIPKPNSHKGQNGKVMVIAGSKLFHAASLWALEAASHLVDMVYFSSTLENNKIVSQAKQEFRNGIIVPRDKIDEYIDEADSILIGPGLPRPDGQEKDDDDTRSLTRSLLDRHKDKRWVIDGGSLQTMDPEWIPKGAILTPHVGEYCTLFNIKKTVFLNLKRQSLIKLVQKQAKKHSCVIILKGKTDLICSSDKFFSISGGNAGMSKGGTGDVLAGISVGLYAKNDAFLSATASSYFNKKAAERLHKSKGYWFNTSDLVDEIPRVMRSLLI